MFIALLTPVAVVVFDFFDIQVETYGNYLFWFIAMSLFNALLPFETKNIFLEIDDIELPTKGAVSATGALPTTGALPADITLKVDDILMANSKTLPGILKENVGPNDKVYTVKQNAPMIKGTGYQTEKSKRALGQNYLNKYSFDKR